MSVESWAVEFYPVPASEAAENDKEALNHSERKWIGLRKENLKKHKVIVHSWQRTVVDESPIPIKKTMSLTSASCALCIRHDRNDCVSCPLYEVRGVACDSSASADNQDIADVIPYFAMMDDNDPEPMINLIQEAKKRIKE